MLVLGLVIALGPLAGRANHCATHVYIFSQPVWVEHNAVLCSVDDSEDTDARVIVPGSIGVSVRYFEPESTEPELYWVRLSGSLFPQERRVRARRYTLSSGTTVYETDVVTFPAGRGAEGCVTATVEVVDDERNTQTSRTALATC